MKTSTRSKSSSKTTVRAKSAKNTPSTGAASSDVGGELKQLADIRSGFAAIESKLARALHARHDDASCRARGTRTRSGDVFRAGMTWARTLAAHRNDPVVSPIRARWFLDCLTDLGVAMTGVSHASDPAATASYLDAVHVGERLWQRTVRKARNAVGTQTTWVAQLDAVTAANESGLDDRGARLTRLAHLLEQWLAGSDAPPLGAFDLSSATVRELRDAARTTESAIANRPAPKQIDRDGPEINTAEGRVLFAMRVLWDDLAEGREEGRTSLQFTVSPTLLRALDLSSRRTTPTPAKTAAPAPQA